MPKKIDPALKERCVRMVREHRGDYPSLTAAAAAVAKHERLAWVTVTSATIVASAVAIATGAGDRL